MSIRYWQSYAIQSAAYALGVPYDVDTETRGAWPFEVSHKWAIIAHLDVLGAIEEGEARCTLVLCDLEAGIAAGDLCMQAVEWGSNDAVFSPPEANPEMVVAVPVEQVKPASDDDFDKVNGEACSDTQTNLSSAPSETLSNLGSEAPSIPPLLGESSEASPPTTTFSTRRSTILAHLATLPDAQKARIRKAWPQGVPSLKGTHAHTDDQLDRIEAVIAEQTWMRARGAVKPRQFERDMATLARPKENECTPPSGSSSPSSSDSLSPGASVPIDEGPLVDDDTVEALRQAFLKLDDDAKTWLMSVSAQAANAGYPLNLKLGQTTRRFSIARAALHMAKSGCDDETARCLIGVVMGEELQPVFTVGQALTALTIDEANRLADLACELGLDGASVRFDDDGAMQVYGPAVDAARRVA